ncbi:MAG: (d)CMP kinase [Candidatus Omnitrophica bacterium]|nr:(d)CMP kinase [Candidatus Omnitrophota bacterium]
MTASVKPEIIVIAIDGPAGAGKSTVAKILARRLSISYLDTGAMYRALTFKALREKINLEDGSQLAELAKTTKIQLKASQFGLRIFLDGDDVSEEIRSVEVTNNTFYIARAPEVRAIMVGLQRQLGEQQSVVAEGRDIGTVVFPKATKKFYLDADFKERAQRRIKELQAKGKTVNEQQLQDELNDRDQKDFTRKVGPLKKADDAIVIDSTGLTAEETAEKILQYFNK